MTSASEQCLFCRIARGEIPSRKVYEDDEILAFHDINPAAPVHFLVIPKVHLDNLYDADLAHADLLGRMMGRVGRQEVYHLHMHVLGGPEPLRSGMKKHVEGS